MKINIKKLDKYYYFNIYLPIPKSNGAFRDLFKTIQTTHLLIMKESSLNFEKMAAMAVVAKDYEVVFQSLDDVPSDGKTVTMKGREMK